MEEKAEYWKAALLGAGKSEVRTGGSTGGDGGGGVVTEGAGRGRW